MRGRSFSSVTRNPKLTGPVTWPRTAGYFERSCARKRWKTFEYSGLSSKVASSIIFSE